jgi:hypothetical protein
MRNARTQRPGGVRHPELPAAANTAARAGADGRGGQRHLPVAPPRSLSSTPFFTTLGRTPAGPALLALRARIEARA